MRLDAFEMFISVTFLLAGLLTLAVRNKQNPFIGVRVGYTYVSKEAWRKANTVGGLFFVFFSLILVGLSLLDASEVTFMLVMVAGLIGGLIVPIAVAKKTYEMEELSMEAPEKPAGRRILVNIRPYLFLQLTFLGVYLLIVALNWDKLPEIIAVHFNASGTPNGFMSRTWGALGVPVLTWGLFFLLTVLGRNPGFSAGRERFSPLGWFEFNTLMSFGTVLVFSAVVLYNAGKLPLKTVSYSIWLLLALAFLGTYRIFTVKGNERV
ncbi:DUF1648 domain-containing protein [Thermococcus sp.]|uniref:DUF1648 domain-containing protein n=1 Tax=Thermococcus sp. TaxID=35749 RepID=UPI0026355DAA|nr:DUF1648 domain-containing protein [Thermococcus sp.]